MKNEPRTNQDKLIALVKAIKTGFFHAPDKTAYVTFTVNGHRETHALRGKQFELYLGKLYWKKFGTVVGKHAIEDALGVLEGIALFEGKETNVYRRVAHFKGRIYVDLCDVDWRVVEISKTRWMVLKKSPVKFVRSSNAEALPQPKRGGSLEQLRSCINACDDATWILLDRQRSYRSQEKHFGTFLCQFYRN